MRASGVVSLLLLTAVFVLGIVVVAALAWRVRRADDGAKRLEPRPA